MNKILLIAFGLRGDVQPYLALSKALSAQGAAMKVNTSKTLNGAIESHGLAQSPIPSMLKN